MLVTYNRVRGMRTSGLLFLFWFILALCGGVRYRYELNVVNDEQVTTCSKYCMVGGKMMGNSSFPVIIELLDYFCREEQGIQMCPDCNSCFCLCLEGLSVVSLAIVFSTHKNSSSQNLQVTVRVISAYPGWLDVSTFVNTLETKYYLVM